MKLNNIKIIPLLFTLLILTSCAFSATKTSSLKVGIIGDQTGTSTLNDLRESYAILQKGVDILNKQDPDLVLHIGDLVESTLDERAIRKDFAKANRILSTLKAKWYLSAGDHDVNPPLYIQNSTDLSREKLFQSLYSNVNPLASGNLYYSFDVGDYHFISLYSGESLHTDPRWGNVFFTGISEAQYSWLAGDLKANSTKTGIVVFVHQPLWYNWSSWSRVHELLSRYPVIAVVAGHFHYNQFEGSLDEIQYWVVGATGAKTKTGSKNAGDLQHVTVMTLTDKQVEFKVISVDDESVVGYSTRYYMDRIQAIDQTLGNTWNFTSENPVYLKGNSLVSDCDSNIPARLKISSIGNPTDLPVTLKITLSSDDVAIKSSGFAKGLCLPATYAQGRFECTLPPSQWISISNTSLTQLSYDKKGQALWEATLDLKDDPSSDAQPIDLRILMEIQAPNKDIYSIYHDVSTLLRICPSN